MNKEDLVYTHTEEYYSAAKKKEKKKVKFCHLQSNMDGLGGRYAK